MIECPAPDADVLEHFRSEGWAVIPDVLFTGDTALPGSGSMNAIWCLHDIDEDKGATRLLPGSHRLTWFADYLADWSR